jgi:PAS domain S-box-containing protein
LGKGDSAARAPLRGGGESLQLAEEFNRMADSLDRNIKELAASEGRLQSILDNTRATVYLKDPGGRFLFVNRRFEELTGLSSDQIVGGIDLDVFPEARALVNRANDLRVLASGEAMELEETLESEDGPHTFSSVRFPVMDGDGKAYAVCGIATDITERKSAEELQLRLSDAKRRRAHALEINDNIVQGLTVALYSLVLGDEGQARQAIEETLGSARSLISEALDEQPIGPGDLVRRRAASVADRKPGESEGKDAASSG